MHEGSGASLHWISSFAALTFSVFLFVSSLACGSFSVKSNDLSSSFLFLAYDSGAGGIGGSGAGRRSGTCYKCGEVREYVVSAFGWLRSCLCWGSLCCHIRSIVNTVLKYVTPVQSVLSLLFFWISHFAACSMPLTLLVR